MSEHMALTVACDVCGKPFWYSEDGDKRERPKPVKTAAWFDTEQNEGKPCEPYLETVEIDICPDCAERGIRLRASGAMGFNDYRIRDSDVRPLRPGECRVTASSTDGLMSDEPRLWVELSCGHSFTVEGLERPSTCAVCGKEVVR